ncbi:MAG: acetylxylan esterase [Planctomycetaceae bacterium]|nr:acetylxylan esterase [Planctomycetaceae bacterium]
MRKIDVVCAGTVVLMAVVSFGVDWPGVEKLPEVKGLPNPLVMFDGTPVKTTEQWRTQRRPELISLFEYYMYGKAPAAPDNLTFTVEADKSIFDGKAVRRIVTLRFGPEGTPPVSLLLVTPAKPDKPVPVFIGLGLVRDKNALDDPNALLPDGSPWARYWKESIKNIEHAVDRGYAVAVMFPQEICPDIKEGDEAFVKGIHRGYMKAGQTRPGPHEWAAIAAWAWGLQRGVDYLVQDSSVDAKRIIVVGHSRFGKTALLAGALDERIALAIPSQAGCGGTAPSRTQVGEKVARINTVFPHWFNDTFKQFNDKVEKLPFDQHCLMALVAPRPLLLTCATEDEWSNPHGQFDMLTAAAPVYELLGVKDALASKEFPKENILIDSRLGYFIRPGKHSVTTDDWNAWMDFADKQLETQ